MSDITFTDPIVDEPILNSDQRRIVIFFDSILLAALLLILILSLYVCLFQLRRVKIQGYYIWTFYLCTFMLVIIRIVELILVVRNPNEPYYKCTDSNPKLS